MAGFGEFLKGLRVTGGTMWRTITGKGDGDHAIPG